MNANQKLMMDLQGVFHELKTPSMVLRDFTKTFKSIKAPSPGNLAEKVIGRIIHSGTIEEAEFEVDKLFLSEDYLKNGKTVFDLIQKGLRARLETIFWEITPYLKEVENVIDYGCGSGLLAQMVHNMFKIPVRGVDIRDFRPENVSVPFTKLNGYYVPVADKTYECGVVIHVLHHDPDNEKILQELNRIVSKKLIVIETVPEAETEEEAEKDWNRMLWNDVLWNRFFNHADIPCPGTYDLPKNWIERIEKYGWNLFLSRDLGFDISTIQDRHHLLVFER